MFFKAKWELLGPSIHEFIIQVFSIPNKIGDINHTLLTLIPKVHEPTKPSDFRPIALCNVIYKIITKILANRIKQFLPDIITQNQTSFIAGRNATDNAIILQEVVHSMSIMTGRKRYMVIKLDLAKAYDKMEWSFIREFIKLKASSLSQAGWISLAQSCIMSIPSYVMQCSKILASICDEAERLCSDFIWGSTLDARRNHLISWETIYSLKEMGGLGFRSMRMVNVAYLMNLG